MRQKRLKNAENRWPDIFNYLARSWPEVGQK